jgi:hypothetical protein
VQRRGGVESSHDPNAVLGVLPHLPHSSHDPLQVITGKHKGQQGEVLRVIRDKRWPRIFVSKINMVREASSGSQAGG